MNKIRSNLKHILNGQQIYQPKDIEILSNEIIKLEKDLLTIIDSSHADQKYDDKKRISIFTGEPKIELEHESVSSANELATLNSLRTSFEALKDLETKKLTKCTAEILQALRNTQYNFEDYIKKAFWEYISTYVDIFDRDPSTTDHGMWRYIKSEILDESMSDESITLPDPILKYTSNDVYTLANAEAIDEWMKTEEGAKAFFHKILFGSYQLNILKNFKLSLNLKYLDPNAKTFLTELNKIVKVEPSSSVEKYLIERLNYANVEFENVLGFKYSYKIANADAIVDGFNPDDDLYSETFLQSLCGKKRPLSDPENNSSAKRIKLGMNDAIEDVVMSDNRVGLHPTEYLVPETELKHSLEADYSSASFLELQVGTTAPINIDNVHNAAHHALMHYRKDVTDQALIIGNARQELALILGHAQAFSTAIQTLPTKGETDAVNKNKPQLLAALAEAIALVTATQTAIPVVQAILINGSNTQTRIQQLATIVSAVTQPADPTLHKLITLLTEALKVAIAKAAAGEPQLLQNDFPMITVVPGDNDIYELRDGAVNPNTIIYSNAHPMNVWNKLAFYGSYRHIGQWCNDQTLVAAVTNKIIKVDVNFRSAVGQPINTANLRKIGIKKEDSYVATPYYAAGKSYPQLTGTVAGGHAAGFNSITYATYDEMLGDAGFGILGNAANVQAEANVYRVLYSSNLPFGTPPNFITALHDSIERFTHTKITVDGFINCYKLIIGDTINGGITVLNHPIDQDEINISCNLRVFELFAPVVIAEVHRNSYTAIINAAMMDLFKTPREAVPSFYEGNDNEFYSFFGDKPPPPSPSPAPTTKLSKHTMAFGGATGHLNDEELGNTIHWYAAEDENIVYDREKQVTKNWLDLLHNYECWLLTHNKLNSIEITVNGALRSGNNYNSANDVQRKQVNFDANCIDHVVAGKSVVWPEANWVHLRTSFKIYAAYQTAKHLNSWNYREAVHDTEIAEKLNLAGFNDLDLGTRYARDADNTANPPIIAVTAGINNALYQEIVDCIHQAVGVNGGCQGAPTFPGLDLDDINNPGDAYQRQEVCIDILCGLLQTNYLDYLN